MTIKPDIDGRFTAIMTIVAKRCQARETEAVGNTLVGLFAELTTHKKRYADLTKQTKDVIDVSQKVIEQKIYKSVAPIITLVIGLAVGYFLR